MAYWGDPATGDASSERSFEHWIWDVAKVRSFVADQTHRVTFFCGGSRNSGQFIDCFEAVFVLEIDEETLNRRLAARDAGEWSGSASEGEANARRQHATRFGLPNDAISVDATAPVALVVDEILDRCGIS